MKKLLFLIPVLVLAGATGTPAVAQQYDPAYGYGQSNYSNGNDGYEEDSGDDNEDSYDYADRNDDGDRDNDGTRDDRDERIDNGDRGDYRADNNRDYRDGQYRNGQRDHRDDRRPEHSRADRRHDGRRYAQQRYRAPTRYAYPRGYRAGKWNVGSRLPSGYYSRSNYVNYRNYHLSAPPRGYQWVRVNNDVYMVSPASGLVRDILYGLFY